MWMVDGGAGPSSLPKRSMSALDNIHRARRVGATCKRSKRARCSNWQRLHADAVNLAVGVCMQGARTAVAACAHGWTLAPFLLAPHLVLPLMEALWSPSPLSDIIHRGLDGACAVTSIVAVGGGWVPEGAPTAHCPLVLAARSLPPLRVETPSPWLGPTGAPCAKPTLSDCLSVSSETGTSVSWTGAENWRSMGPRRRHRTPG